MTKAEREQVLSVIKELRGIAYQARRELPTDDAVAAADELIMILEHQARASAMLDRDARDRADDGR